MTYESDVRTMPEIRVPAALTFAGLALGLIAGLLLAETSWEAGTVAIVEPVGALWLQALKMTILPLVAGLLFTGIVQTVETARGGRAARRTVSIILGVLALSAVIGVTVTPLLLALSPVPQGAAASFGAQIASEPGAVPGFADFLASLLPENVIAAAASDAMLPFVIFISLFAFAAMRLAPAHREVLAPFFEALAAAMMVVIGWVLMLAPIGVFALALGLAASSGTAAIGALVHYIAIVSLAGAVILAGGYVIGLWRRGAGFVRAMLPAQAVAISTQSSLASLPAMLVSCRMLGVRSATADFVLPLAVAVFRATSPAMNLAVAIYAAHLTGTPLTAAALIAGAGVAILVSLGSVSLPGTLSFVASIGPIAIAMGVPVEPLAILVAVEMLPDVMRTVGNVTMDVALASAVDEDGDLDSFV